MGLFVLGRWLLNTPFDPDLRKLPPIYFSDHWRWEPAENVNPRPEVWGGLLVAFAGLMAYLTLLKGDRLGRNLGLWGIIGGLGFPIGQSLQAATAWDGATFQKNSYWQVGVNTWNLMEVTFGTVAGLALGIGLWCNRRAIAQDDEGEVSLSTEAEGWLIGSYTYLLCMSWYFGDTIFVLIQYHGLLMGILPMIAIVGGRYSALLYTFPVIAIPITFKTFLAICGSAEFEAKSIGLIAIVTVPLALLTAIALEWGKPRGNRRSARTFASEGLLLTSALYFWMNFSFFSFPWGWWSDWQGLLGQRQSGGIYIVAWVVLSLAAVQFWLKDRQQPATGR